ncbi:MAG: acylneuraminate cytidylyltransferase family protein [Ignavibacteriales bacterium]|nr:acylneuraminate cytidylyltransferase family protein [Ignavibacteriales bacterium]
MNVPEIKALLFMKQHSERIPGKNMKIFYGKPLLHWILESLSGSIYISEIIINTDSEIIANEASKHFSVTIHKRPDYLLTINSNEANQILDYDLSITKGNYFLQTHSTNPLLKTRTIDRSIEEFFKNSHNDSLLSVTPLQTRLFFHDGKPINHDPEKLIKTQELAVIYEENSCIYIFSREGFLKNKNRIGKSPLLFPIDRLEAVDIDEKYDFLFAEFLKQKNI